MAVDPVSRPWRRFLRFSVRGLIVIVLLIGVGLGWIGHSATSSVSRAAIAERRGRGYYRWQWDGDRYFGLKGDHGWPKWLVDALGIDFFSRVVRGHIKTGSEGMATLAACRGWSG